MMSQVNRIAFAEVPDDGGVALRESVAIIKTSATSVEAHFETPVVGESLRIEGISFEVLEVLLNLHKGLRCEELNFEPVDEAALEDILTVLRANGMLRPIVSDLYQSTIVERQVAYYSEYADDIDRIQASLNSANVVLVGCGGTSNIVAQSLVGAGVRCFHLIDGDIVEIDNLNRQFCFKESDLRRPKVDVLADYILDRNSSCLVTKSRVWLAKPSDLFEMLADETKPDLLICGADTPPILIEIIVAEAALKLDTKAIFGGVGLHTYTLGPILRTRDSLTEFIERNVKSLQTGCFTKPMRASFGARNAIAGSRLAEEAIAEISGFKTSTLVDRRLRFFFDDEAAEELDRYS